MGLFTPSASAMSAITTDDHAQTPPPSTANTSPIPVDLSSTNLTEEQKVQLQSLLSEYRDIFALTPEELGRTGLVKHRIDTGDHPPLRQRPYRVAEHQRGIVEEHITDILNRGIIQPTIRDKSS